MYSADTWFGCARIICLSVVVVQKIKLKNGILKMIIGGYVFTEPKEIKFTDWIEKAAVYVVMTHDTRNWFYVYVGQTRNVSERFDGHEKWKDWLKNEMIGGLYLSVLPVSRNDLRLNIETELRNKLPWLPCNKQ